MHLTQQRQRDGPLPRRHAAVTNKHGPCLTMSAVVFSRKQCFILPFTLTPQSCVAAACDPTPRRCCCAIMQNPIGFDLGTKSGPELLRWESRWGKEASLIEFYVAVVGDLNMPEFITWRIIMSYKNWQSQIGPHTSSLPHHHWGGPVTASLHFKCIRLLFFFSENETFVFDIGEKKNQYEFRNHT